MGVDLKDITDLLPFIVENLSKCIYIIVVCLIAGFFVGKLLQKSKIQKPNGLAKYYFCQENLVALRYNVKSCSRSLINYGNEKELLHFSIPLFSSDHMWHIHRFSQ